MEEKDQPQMVSEEPINNQPEPTGSVDRKILDVTRPDDFTGNQKVFSPLRFLIITIGGIFLAEIVAMVILTNFSALPYYLLTLIDASIMVLLIFPVIYIFSLKPLLLHIEKHQRMEISLRQSEDRFVKAFHSNPAALSITRHVDGLFIDVNESFLRLYGSNRQEVIGHSSIELDMFVNFAERDEIVQHTLTRQSLAQEGIRNFPLTARIKSGEIRDILISTEAINLDGETCIIASMSDITEKKLAETRLRRLNRGLSVMNECNQILVHAENETELLQQMCEIIVKSGGYLMAWVGFAENDTEKSVRPAAQFGFEDNYLERANITWADNEWGRGPTGTAIREGIIQVNQNFLTSPQMAPWREAAIKRGYQSSLALPLKDGSLVLGALAIYSSTPDAFDCEEVGLLSGMANDLAYGISALREREERKRVDEKLRIANDELELRVQDRTKELRIAISEMEEEINVRKKAEYQLETVLEELRHSEHKFSLIFDKAAFAASLSSLPEDVLVDVNQAWVKIFGYTRQEAVGKTTHALNINPNEEARKRIITQLQEWGYVKEQEVSFSTKSGEWRIFLLNADLVDIGGQNYILNVAQDITERKLAEEALRLSEQELKNAQAVATIGNWSWNVEKGEITWSDEMYRIFGIDKNTYTGRLGDVIAKVIHPDDLYLVQPSNTQMFAEKKPIEYRIILQDKSIRNIWAKSGEATFDNEGKPIFLTGIAQDITERKQAEEKLNVLNEELTRFNRAMVGRELRMIELKKEINELCTQAGHPPRYGLDFEKEAQ